MLSSNTKKGEIERAFRPLKVFWCLMTTLGELTTCLGTNGFIVSQANEVVLSPMFIWTSAKPVLFVFGFVAWLFVLSRGDTQKDFVSGIQLIIFYSKSIHHPFILSPGNHLKRSLLDIFCWARLSPD
jgi:hypothetical protein